MTFSTDSARFAYCAEGESGKQVVVLDGVAGPEYDVVFRPHFSPNSKSMAYAAVVATDPAKGYSLMGGMADHKSAKVFIVVNGRAGDGYDGISLDTLTFSPDGNHLAYIARRDAKWTLVADGQAGADYDEVVRSLPAPDGGMDFMSIKDKTLYRVECMPRQ